MRAFLRKNERIRICREFTSHFWCTHFTNQMILAWLEILLINIDIASCGENWQGVSIQTIHSYISLDLSTTTVQQIDFADHP